MEGKRRRRGLKMSDKGMQGSKILGGGEAGEIRGQDGGMVGLECPERV
jgi:hypothetical protein